MLLNKFYDEFRLTYPVDAQPSEFKDIVDNEIKRAIRWTVETINEVVSAFPECSMAQKYIASILEVSCGKDNKHPGPGKGSNSEST